MTRLNALPILIAAALVPLAAQAAEPMGAQAFESYVTGKTLWYDSMGSPYGVERYLPDRRVQWSFLDGECKEGTWYEDAGQICFVYDDGTGPQCWTFFQGTGGLSARFAGDPPGTELYAARENDDPMLCYGPDVGV